MMLFLLGMVDIFAALLILFPWISPQALLIFGILLLAKGIFSVAGATASGYYYDLLGWIDIATGFCMLLGISLPFLWIFPMIKGLFSVVSFLSN